LFYINKVHKRVYTFSTVVWIHPVQCHYNARKKFGKSSKAVDQRPRNSDLQAESEFFGTIQV